MRLFVFLPLSAETRGLEATLARLDTAAQQHRWTMQVVVVDDRGRVAVDTDLTAARTTLAIEQIAHRYPRGLRETVRDGIEWIGDRCQDDDVALLLCAPDITDVTAIPLMLAALEAGADVAVAAAGASAATPPTERIRSAIANLPARVLFRLASVRNPLSPTLAIRGATLRAALQQQRGQLLGAATPTSLLPLELLDCFARNDARCTQVDVPIGALPKVAGAPLSLGDHASGVLRLHTRLRQAHALPLQPRPPEPLARWEWGALAGVLVVALAVRLYALSRIPEVIFHDECDNLVNVYQILNGRGPTFFGFDWKPQPAASIYILTAFMRLGMSVFTLRLPAALYSTLALIPFYMILRRAVAVPAALSATALLATDLWYLHFSRTGWENVATCIFLCAAALTIRDALRSGRMRSFAWTGVWSALGAYSYFAGRAVYPSVLLACIAALWRPRIPRRTIIGGVLLTTVVALMLFAPQLPNIVRNWDQFQKRSRTVSLLGHGEGVFESASLAAGSFTAKSTELFFGRDTPDRYLRMTPGPLVTPTVLLLVAGMIVSFWWRQETTLWWIFLLVPFVLTQVLTTGDLNGARGVIFVPILYLFVGLSIHTLLQAATAIARPLTGIVLAGMGAIAIASTLSYFTWVQSPRLVQDLYPSFPVAEFSAWQAHVFEWTKRTDDFFNVYMWEEAKKKMQPAVTAAP
jgi:hypothetical protein